MLSSNVPHQRPCLEAMAMQGWLKSLMGKGGASEGHKLAQGGLQMEMGFPGTLHLGRNPSGLLPLSCQYEAAEFVGGRGPTSASV